MGRAKNILKVELITQSKEMSVLPYLKAGFKVEVKLEGEKIVYYLTKEVKRNEHPKG